MLRESVLNGVSTLSLSPSGNANTEEPTRTRTPLVPPSSGRIERGRHLSAAIYRDSGGERENGKNLKVLLRRSGPRARYG